MPFQPTSKIWHNGKLIPWDQANIHVMSHVVHYGSSVFEGIRCYGQPQGSAIFRLPEHMQRLLDSAKIYRIAVPYTLDERTLEHFPQLNDYGIAQLSDRHVLVIDRENEESLLRRGLLPARALPRAEQSQPNFVARTYQRHTQR